MGNVCDPPHLEYTGAATIFSEKTFNGVNISVLQGDICDEDVDIVVNVSNPHLQVTSGISKNIISKAGKEVEKEMTKLMSEYPQLNVGTAVHTLGGDLEADFIIHAIVPSWNGGNSSEKDKLEQAMKACLVLSNDLKASSIAIPSLSSGIIGFPKDFCAEIMMTALKKFLQNNSATFKTVRFINADNPTVRLFKRAFEMEFLNFGRLDEGKINSDSIELIEGNNSKGNSNKIEEISILKDPSKNSSTSLRAND